MSIEFPFVAVDWGTTHMRAFLYASIGDVTDRIDGPGIGQLTGAPGDVLLDRIDAWVDRYGLMDLLVCGMAGSNIGWRSTPYLKCPLRLVELANNLFVFEERGHRVAIVPGASCANALGQPDVMRGEEVQVLGCLTSRAETGDALVCLPGTHTKWVRTRDGDIESFTTSMTGELYAVLCRHSVLIAGEPEVGLEFDESAFVEGVRAAARHGDKLSHLLFSTRSRSVMEPETSGDASSYLSGLLIGADVRSALRRSEQASPAIQLVGTRGLCERFALALETMDFSSSTANGDDMVVAGFARIAESAAC